MSADSNRSRFFVKTVTSHTGSSMFIPQTSGTADCNPIAPSTCVRCAPYKGSAAAMPATASRARNRRPTHFGVHRFKLPPYPAQRHINHRPNGSQQTVLGHSLLRRYVAEDPALLMIRTPHPSRPHRQLVGSSLYSLRVSNASFSASC
jgi:hypothetical protein